MGFTILHHRDLKLVEAIYPPRPTPEDVDDYLHRIRAAMEAAHAEGDWCCLVDQRNVTLMDPRLVDQIATINAFARENGMRKSARLVKGAMATLQAGRIARAAELGDAVKTFEDRALALAWLQEP